MQRTQRIRVRAISEPRNVVRSNAADDPDGCDPFGHAYSTRQRIGASSRNAEHRKAIKLKAVGEFLHVIRTVAYLSVGLKLRESDARSIRHDEADISRSQHVI